MSTHSIRLSIATCLAAMACAGPAMAAFLPGVRFTQTEYTIPSATAQYQVDVIIDADRTLAGIQPLPAGLTSFGLSLLASPLEARVVSVDDITVVPAMDSGPLGGPAEKSVGLTFASVKAFVPLTDPAYTGSSLVSFLVTGVSDQPYTLSLGLFEQGAADASFVDGDGNELDSVLTFGTARVSVIPEPGLAGFLALFVPLISRRRR